MAPRRIVLASPREPSGVTWLINCLLCLGIRTYRRSRGGMWRRRGSRERLAPHEQHLRKWLPVLSDREDFTFNAEVEVEWTHEFPTREATDRPALFFVRDPRDALLSRYRREAGDLPFTTFLEVPDPLTLLDKIEHWSLFTRCWLAAPSLLGVVRFEDYKRAPRQTLEAALAALGVARPPAEVEAALAASTSQRAAHAEQRYREAHPEDRQLINRAGQVGGWRDATADEAPMRRVTRQAAPLLDRLGYERYFPGEEESLDLGASLQTLRCFARFHLPADIEALRATPLALESLDRRWARLRPHLAPATLEAAGLTTHERSALADSLGELAWARERAAFATLDGGTGLPGSTRRWVLHTVRSALEFAHAVTRQTEARARAARDEALFILLRGTGRGA